MNVYCIKPFALYIMSPTVKSCMQATNNFRPWQDSNLQSPDPKSGALSIRPQGQLLVRKVIKEVYIFKKVFHFYKSCLFYNIKYFCIYPSSEWHACAGILEHSIGGARNRVGIVLSYRPAWARIYKPFMEPRNRFSPMESIPGLLQSIKMSCADVRSSSSGRNVGI